MVALAEARAPKRPRFRASPAAAASSASSHETGSQRPSRRTIGRTTRSFAWTKPVPKRPLTQSMPSLERFCGHVVGHDREPPVVPHRVHDAAAHAAVGTGGLDPPLDTGRRLLRAERAGRAGGDALAAGRADGGRHEAVAEDADPLGVAAAEEADRADPLDVVAGGRAPPAEDACLAVEHEEGLRVVDGVRVERRPARRRKPVAGRRLAELAEAIAAVAAVAPIAGVSMERVRSRTPRRRRVTPGVSVRDRHPLARREVARGGESPLALDLDQARAAGTEGRPVRVLAELGEGDAEAVHGVEDRGALGHLHGLRVDGQQQRHDVHRILRAGTPGGASTRAALTLGAPLLGWDSLLRPSPGPGAPSCSR